MEEITNIEIARNLPRRIRREEIDTHNWKVIVALKRQAPGICQNDLNEAYINNILNKLKAHTYTGFIYYDEYAIPIGFIVYTFVAVPVDHLLNADKYRYAELFLICARENKEYIGSAMLQQFEEFCRTKGCRYIKLRPATQELVSFYYKNGFREHAEGVPGSSQVFMMNKIIEPLPIRRGAAGRAAAAASAARPAIRIREIHPNIEELNAITNYQLVELYNRLPAK
jgi:GNAT superfamily N-acetyltransferase